MSKTDHFIWLLV